MKIGLSVVLEYIFLCRKNEYKFIEIVRNIQCSARGGHLVFNTEVSIRNNSSSNFIRQKKKSIQKPEWTFLFETLLLEIKKCRL